MSLGAAELFDSLYQLASSSTEDDLFGTSAPLAREAFRRGLAGNAMPTVWFEIPLCGPPRFDLHVAHSNTDLHSGAPFAPDAANGYGALLNWYASEPREGGGLAFAFDVGDGRIDDPAVHANVNAASDFDAEGFFTHVGRPDAATLYDAFAGKLSQGWRVWYFGVHPGRPSVPVRVDCFVNESLQQAYAAEPAKLEEDLHGAGVADVGAQTLRIGAEIAASPLDLELQFDVLSGGEPGPTVSLSARFPIVSANNARPLWAPGGSAAALMEFALDLGVADGRWQRIEDALFTKIVRDGNDMLALYCIPVFAKFRLRAGAPLDAKIYLQASAQTLN